MTDNNLRKDNANNNYAKAYLIIKATNHRSLIGCTLKYSFFIIALSFKKFKDFLDGLIKILFQ